MAIKVFELDDPLLNLICLLRCTLGSPSLFDNPVFVRKHSCEPPEFWEIKGCLVYYWEAVALKTKQLANSQIIMIITHEPVCAVAVHLKL